MKKEDLAALRQQLIRAMRGDQSHIEFDSVVDDFPREFIGDKPAGAPHSGWHLLEHLRIAQHDILEFSRDPKYQSPKWPDDYWPQTDGPPADSSWDQSVAAFKQDAAALEKLIDNPGQDLFAAIEGGDGQTLLREALVVAAHNSYHLGQLEFLKKMLLAANYQ